MDFLITLYYAMHTISFLGSQKLAIENTRDLKVYLDDGFEIDEDEILLSQVTDNRILVLASNSDFNSCGMKQTSLFYIYTWIYFFVIALHSCTVTSKAKT